MKNHVYTSVLVVLTSSACATAPNSSLHALKETVLSSHVTVAPIDKPAKLSQKTKAQAIGNFVVASVAGSVAGSAGNAANPQQFQNNFDIGQAFGRELSKALPTSYQVGLGQGADLALAKKLSDYFSSKSSTTVTTDRELSIKVNAPLWELAYVSFLTSQDYALNYQLHVSVLEEKNGKLEMLKTTSCASSTKEKMPLEKWKAENYKYVDIHAQAIVDECFTQFLAEAGLDR